jgi:PAS domain S-box-containing protein
MNRRQNKNISNNQEGLHKSIHTQCEKCNQFIRHASDAIVLTNEQGEIIEWNPAQEELSGLSFDHVRGRKVWDVQFEMALPEMKIPENLKKIHNIFKEYFRTGQGNFLDKVIEMPIIKKSGETQFIEQRSFKITTPDGFMLGSLSRDVTSKNKTIQKIRQSEERYRLMAENAVDCIWQLDKNLKFTYLSPSLYDMTGYHPEEWIGTTPVMHIVKSEYNTLSGLATEVMRKEKSRQQVCFETRIIKKDGTDFPVEIIAKPLIDSTGNIIGIQGSTRDVSERKLLQQAIEENEKKYRSFVSQSKDGLVMTDENGAVIEWNNVMTTITGIRADEILQTKIWDADDKLMNPEQSKNYNRDDFKRSFKQFFKQGKADFLNKIIEVTVFDKSGKRHDLEQISFKIDSPAGYRLGAIIREITEKKQTLKKLRASEERYRWIVENSSELVTVFADDEIIYISPSVKNLLGYEQDEFLKLNHLDLIHPDDRHRVERTIKNRIKFKVTYPHTYGYRQRHKKGHYVWLETISGTKVQKDDHFQTVLNSRDISERIEADQIIRMNEEKYRNLVERSPIGIGLSRNNIIEYTNEALLKIYGMKSMAGMHEKDLDNFVHPEDKNMIRQTMSKIENGDVKYPVELKHKIIAQDKTIKHIVVNLSEYYVGKERFSQGIFRDVTEEIKFDKAKRKLAAESLYVSQKNQILTDIKNEIKSICQNNPLIDPVIFDDVNKILDYNINFDKDWKLLESHFSEIHSDFFKNLKTRFPLLTQNDLKHCALMKINIDTKEIARMLNVKPTSIQIARVRLKKKLNLEPDADLRSFILSF